MNRDRYEIHVQSETGADLKVRYHAELWVNPFNGWLLARTRDVSSMTWARRDATRVFGPFMDKVGREREGKATPR